MSRTILDATVWLNFARVDWVATLVEGLPNLLAVGLLVEREVKKWPRQSSREGQEFSLGEYVTRGLLERAEMSANEMSAFHETKTRLRLGDGETEALVIAMNRGWTVATDDGAARRKGATQEPPVNLTGTIGLLRELVQTMAVTRNKAAEMLKLMRERGGRLPDEEI